MTEIELHEKIIAYLEGRLSPEAADEFRLQIKADKALAEEVNLQLERQVRARMLAETKKKLAEEVEFQRLLWLVGQRLVALDMKAKFDNWQKEAEQPSFVQAAEISDSPAPVAVITQPYKQLAQSELAPMITSTRSAVRGGKRSGSTAESLLAKADTAIENRLYQRAEKLLLGIAVTDPQYPRALEMLAYTYMMQEKYAAAVSTYQTYIPYNADSDETNWHLCLYYLADYPVYRSEFQRLLQIILADTKHFYHDRAKSLRKKLAETGVWPE